MTIKATTRYGPRPSKITPQDAKRIRMALAYGAPAYRLAREYGVHPSVIENMQKGLTFKTQEAAS